MMMMIFFFFFFFFFFRFQSALLLLRTTADTKQRGREFFVRDALRDFLLCLTSPLFLSLSLAFSFFRSFKNRLLVVGFFLPQTKKKRGVPCTHSHTSPNCALTRVLCYALKESSNMLWTKKKKGVISPLSFGRLFFSRTVILRKKTEKNAPKKNTPTLYPKVSLGLSQQKSDDFDARGTVHARPIDRARKPSLFFLS